MTDPSLHANASALFLELRTLGGEARRVRLEDIGDPALRAEVESLLRYDAPTSGEEGATLQNGSKIGPYTIVRRLGRGGTGYVFLAEQKEPVERRVAVKVVPQAMLDPVVAARFEFERRALEQTEHPNIARVLDAGRTEAGLPYLVVEFVDGVPITAYCAEHGLGLADRVRLMLGVADAVQHAHQRGLIHRDLSPANILVAELDGRPTPRVVDFGIARSVADAAGGELTGGMPLGTPAYMAPEQAGGGVVDTRADTYALGAVLYELVAGRPPIERGADLAGSLERVRTVLPAPASRARGAAGFADHPARALLDDLDVVLACALEKSPDRRYPTPAAFADDLRRVLRREPVAARVPTFGYRAARFVERRRPLVAALALAVLATVGGVGGLSAGLIESSRQRSIALQRAESLNAVNLFLTDDLLAAAAPDESAEGTTAVQLLDRAARRVDARFADRPLIAADIHHTLGVAYTQLGAFDAAERELTMAADLRAHTVGESDQRTIRSRLALASLMGERQDFEGAATTLKALLPEARRQLGPDEPVLYTAINDLGIVLANLGRAEEAVPYLVEALDGRRRLLGENDPDVMVTMSNLAQAYDGMGDTPHSLEMMQEALRVARSLPEQPRMLIIGLANNIGATYQDMGKYDTAAPYLREASDLASEWLGPDNPATLTLQSNQAGLEARLGDPVRGADLYRKVIEASARVLGPDAFDTLSARHGLCTSLRLGGNIREAADGYAALLDDARRTLGEDHWFTAQVHLSLGAALRDLGDPVAAQPHAARAYEVFLQVFGADHPRTKSAAQLEKDVGVADAQGTDGAPKS